MDSYMIRSEQQHETRRMRRRIWFTAHALACVLLSLCYVAIGTPVTLLLLLNTLLLLTLGVHAGWLYAVGVYDNSIQDVTRQLNRTLSELSPQPVPVLSDGEARLVKRNTANLDFWYRWHDLG